MADLPAIVSMLVYIDTMSAEKSRALFGILMPFRSLIILKEFLYIRLHQWQEVFHFVVQPCGKMARRLLVVLTTGLKETGSLSGHRRWGVYVAFGGCIIGSMLALFWRDCPSWLR